MSWNYSLVGHLAKIALILIINAETNKIAIGYNEATEFYLCTWYSISMIQNYIRPSGTSFLIPRGVHCVVFWPSTRANMPFQIDAPEESVTSQWPVIERNHVGGIWLMKWDKVKKIPWYTGREWPVNCMTVIPAWWRSNMTFQGLSGRLSGRWTNI